MKRTLTVVTLLLANLVFSSVSFAESPRKEAIRAYYQALSSNDMKTIVNSYSENITYEDIATGDKVTGRKDAGAFVESFLKGTPGVSIKPSNIIVDGDQASVEWLMSAGKGKDAWSIRGVAIIVYKNGLMSRVSDYWNN